MVSFVRFRRIGRWTVAAALAVLLSVAPTARLLSAAHASTYVVYIPLDSPIYDQLDTLNSLGYLDDYLDEIKPISRIEAARLTLEAQANLAESSRPDGIARALLQDLRDQLHQEIGWLDSNREDNAPTMLQPVERLEAQYIYSHGASRFWNLPPSTDLKAQEGTPLLPNNDGIPTAQGSNEVIRWSGWGGFGGFLTGYGEGAVTGPLGHTPSGTSRIRPLGAEAVLSLGNWALSFGQEEMWWGPGHFETLSMGNNVAPIPGLRIQNTHPIVLPWIFRYLGQFRFQEFFGQLDSERTFSRPWINGQMFAFKPLPTFELGFDHTILFGGRGNDNYSFAGFWGRFTGLSTGTTSTGNTHSRGGPYLKFRFPRLRGAEVFVEMIGEDNFTTELRPIGRFMPILSTSYHGAVYVPRVTADGRTDFRFEWAIMQPGYSSHSDSLYETYNNHLLGDPLGLNSSEMDFQVGRWFRNLAKGSADLFVTERAPKTLGNTFYPANIYGTNLQHERSFGFAFDMLSTPESPAMRADVLSFGRAHLSFEYVNHMNFAPASSVRGVVALTIGIKPTWDGLIWQ